MGIDEKHAKDRGTAILFSSGFWLLKEIAFLTQTRTYREVSLVVRDPELCYRRLRWVTQPFPGELLDSCGLLYDLFILFCSYAPLPALPFHMFGVGFGFHLVVILRYSVASSGLQCVPNSACIACGGPPWQACAGQALGGPWPVLEGGKNQRGYTARLGSKSQLQLHSQVPKTRCVYHAPLNILSKNGICFIFSCSRKAPNVDLSEQVR